MHRRRSAIWKMVTLLKGEDKGRVAHYFAIPVGKKHGTREYPGRIGCVWCRCGDVHPDSVEMCQTLQVLGEYQEQHKTSSSVT